MNAKLLQNMLRDWDSIQDQLEVISGMLLKSMSAKSGISAQAALLLLQNHFFQAGIRLSGIEDVGALKVAFDNALEILKMEARVAKQPHKLRQVKPAAKTKKAARSRAALSSPCTCPWYSR